MRGIGPFLRGVWHLAKPYFTRSEERLSALLLLGSILGMRFALVGMTVVLSYWNREFFNALQAKDWDAFIDLLFLYHRTDSGLMPGFCEVAFVYIVIAIYFTYLSQWLQIRWRRWLTGRFLDNWLTNRAYYTISMTQDRSRIATDNPDQRIAEDVRDFVGHTLTLSISFVANVATLVSFLGILWSLSGTITVFGFHMSGYLVWVAIAYAVVGTWLTHLVGKPLAALRFRQQQVEADFRYALVRFRENMEAVALYRGEEEEKAGFKSRFVALADNWWAIMQRIKRLTALTTGYDEVAGIFPLVVAAPRYFAGQLTLGGLTQTADAFGRVQGTLSWLINHYSNAAASDPSLTSWTAIVERLLSFHYAIEQAHAGVAHSISMGTSADGALHLSGVTIALPDGTRLLDGADLMLTPGHSVVVTGASGTGKSTLFRAIAGIWPFGAGRIEVPPNTFFLPQAPYIPLGALRHVIAYPRHASDFSDDDLVMALADAGLPGLVDQLDADENWASRLSGGEKQRVALARALLAKPDWIFLDEATASLDPEAEEDLYRVLRARLPHVTLVSIAHRMSVAALHEDEVKIQRTVNGPSVLVTVTR
jgi:putative ATP-binding cassette transporter